MQTLEDIAQNGPLNLEQLKFIETTLLANGNFTLERIRKEIAWFCLELGIDQYYFDTTPLELIARHIESQRAAEMIAINSGGTLDLQLASERPDEALYFVAAKPEAIDSVECHIESRYPLFRLQSYRTRGKLLDTFFRIYFVTTPRFAKEACTTELTFEQAADETFLKTSPERTLAHYKKCWEAAQRQQAPYVDVSRKEESGETRIRVTLRRDPSRSFIADFSRVLDTYDIHTSRKYVEAFRNDLVTFSFYMPEITDERTLENLKRDLGAVVLMPSGGIARLFKERRFSVQETLYAVAAATFANQFLTSDSDDFHSIASALEGKPELKGVLSGLKTKMVKDTYTYGRVSDTVCKYPEIARLAYQDFLNRFSAETVSGDGDAIVAKAREEIARQIPWDVERRIMESFLAFNQVVLTTNFFKSEKSSLSFRLNPIFLDQNEYRDRPWMIYFLIGKEFRGFHVRFQDIARGGIRLVRSRSEEAYDFNSDFIFDENYNLALTQQLKNKDIPEGGSKGTILLHLDSQDQAESAFRNYIDGLLDLIVPGEEIKGQTRQELLFLGPDEGTAELMNWACHRAKARGYGYWKAFTTGKDSSLGGVPHDTYGMTTSGIHEYVLGVLEELGIREEEATKVQTGGPDGDLGSNEIKISKDRTLGVVDASGVVYDPTGLDREELLHLAAARKTVSNFDRGKLSSEGFLVTVDDRAVRLPNGMVVQNGEHFRNTFHLQPFLYADLFVPCGGRPRSINIGNWRDLLDANGRPRFKAIVEGANLFITQDARLRLEEAGVILFKDASTNKGGVTSSSLEVLAALALTDEEYEALMCSRGDCEPEFRRLYVQGILEKIRHLARLEYGAIKRRSRQTGTPRSTVSDLLSRKITRLADSIRDSELVADRGVVEAVLLDYCPRVLLDTVGLNRMFERLPANYLHAIVASHVASSYVYQSGLDAHEVDFFKFVSKLGSRS